MLFDAPAFESGVTYGTVPGDGIQQIPEAGQAPAPLTPGDQYLLYVMKDVAIPLARCVFEAP